MKNKLSKHMARSSFLLLTLSALLTACGGGGGGAEPSPVSTERFERLSGGDVRDNTTGIVWAGQLGGDLTNGYSEPTAAELFQLTDLGENTLRPHFSFLFPDVGLAIKAADPMTGLDNHVWAVDFGDAVFGGLMVRSSASTPDYFRWRIKRPAGPAPVPVKYARGVVTLPSLITANNLTWKVCAEGLEFSGGSCVGNEPTRATYDEAMQLAALSNFEGFRGWRLPTPQELRSLLHLQNNVADVSTNAPLLPPAFGTHTGRAAYWTAGTVTLGNPSSNLAWQVDFSGVPELGGLAVSPVGDRAHVRLVRSN